MKDLTPNAAAQIALNLCGRDASDIALRQWLEMYCDDVDQAMSKVKMYRDSIPYPPRADVLYRQMEIMLSDPLGRDNLKKWIQHQPLADFLKPEIPRTLTLSVSVNLDGKPEVESCTANYTNRPPVS